MISLDLKQSLIFLFKVTPGITHMHLSDQICCMLRDTYTYYFFHLSENSEKKDGGVFSVKKILHLLKIPTVFFLIVVKVITGIPFGIFQSMFSLVSMEFFKLEPQQNGFVMSYVGGLSIVSYL